jgi:hypothetical protein
VKRALLIAPYFPPWRRVGALRPWRFATGLREFGWQPTIVRLHPGKETLTPAERALLGDIEVLDVEVPGSATLRRLRTWTTPSKQRAVESSRPIAALPPGRAQSYDPVPREDQRAAAAGGASSGARTGPTQWIADGIDRRTPVDTWMPVLLAALPRLTSWIDTHQPRLLWNTADPWSSHALALALLRLRPALPWIADYRDPWSLCEVRPRSRPEWVRAVDSRVDARVIASATRVVFTADETTQRYATAFPRDRDRLRTIPNAWDARVFGALPDVAPSQALPVSEDGLLRIAFFGRFRPLSSEDAIFDALLALARRAPELAARVRVSCVGGLPPARLSAARFAAIDHCFEAVPSVPQERAPETLRAADLLLLSTHPERADIIPAKLWDYLPVLRPILDLTPNPEVARVVAHTRTGVSLDPRAPEAIADLLAGCVTAVRERRALPVRFAPDVEAIASYETRATTRALAALFDEVVADTHTRDEPAPRGAP